MKKRKITLLSLITLVSLVGCNLDGITIGSHSSSDSLSVSSTTSEDSSTSINSTTSDTSASEASSNTSEKQNSITTSETVSTNSTSSVPTPKFKELDFTKGKAKNIHDLYYNKDGMPTTGNPKVLVVPVDFSDYPANSLNYSIEKLEKAFNTGTKDELDYVNVNDYFYQSSYGQIDIDFDIYPSWIRMSDTFLNYEKMSHKKDILGSTGKNSSCTNEQIILNEALQYLDDQGVDLSQYDSDDNGTIDGIVIIYSAPVNVQAAYGGNLLGWAWRFCNYLADPSDPKNDRYYYDNVFAYDYLWASYQFLFDAGDANYTHYDHLNTYTYIHEFSHVLGADDYYDTEYATKANGDPLPEAQTLWGYDIMDARSGDHNPYTKFLYGWLNKSKLVYEETTITLKDFVSSGETIILSNNWNDINGMFQNYWLLSYYTNTGLNYDKDNESIGLFSSNGLATYLVDATLEYKSLYKGYFIKYNNSYWIDQDGDGLAGTKTKLIKYVKTANDHYLLKNREGDTSDTSSVDTLGRKIPFKYEVLNEENGEITIKFTKNI